MMAMDDFEDIDAELDDLGIELTHIHGAGDQSVGDSQGVGISIDDALQKIGEFGTFQLCALSAIFLASGLHIPFRIMAPVYIHRAYPDFDCAADR
jgi:hypothetical protein